MNDLVEVFGDLLSSTGELLGSKLIHKTDQPYLEAYFVGLNEEFANIEVKIDNISYEFPLDYYDCAYVPRPGTKLIIYPEDTDNSEASSGLRILAIDEKLQLFPLAATYQFDILKATPFDGLVLHNPQYGRIICEVSATLAKKIESREIVERDKVLFKVVQAGSTFMLIPLLPSESKLPRNDFEKICFKKI